ncbi:MAG: hypothetical protein ACR2OI_09855 [Acidimicrobiia bacterium]
MRSIGVVLLLLVAACGGGEEAESALPGAPAPLCADVVEVEVTAETAGTYRFDVTVRSPDTGWEKYADAWEVRSLDGTVLATRVLAHPHVDEQPFTRSLGGVVIPAGVTEVEVAARDLVEGFCGETVAVPIP